MLGGSGPNSNYIWFDPVLIVQVTLDVARQGWKRPAPALLRPDTWKPVLSSFDNRPDTNIKTADGTISPVVNLLSDGGNNGTVENVLSSSKRACQSMVSSGSRSSAFSASGQSTNHPAPAAAPEQLVSLVVEVEKLDISDKTVRPASIQIPKPLVRTLRIS